MTRELLLGECFRVDARYARSSWVRDAASGATMDLKSIAEKSEGAVTARNRCEIGGQALVGKWDGQMRTRGRDDPNRTLIIKSVTEKGGKWSAEGVYGITGRGMGKVTIDVDVTGKRPSIQFTTGANSVVRLELLDKSLVGTLTLAGTREGGSDRSMKLDKVE